MGVGGEGRERGPDVFHLCGLGTLGDVAPVTGVGKWGLGQVT